MLFVLKLLPHSFFTIPKKETILVVLASIIGIIPGIIFVLNNKIYFKSQKNQNTSKKIAAIYALDSLGASLASLLTGLILIPIFGIFETLTFVGLINLWIIWFLYLFEHLSAKNI